MKDYAAITADQTGSEAFAEILRHNLRALEAWEDKARTWDDIEGVHQVRVSFRRLRSALSVFRPILARKDRKYWSQRIKTLVDHTGLARDIDVLIDEGLPAFHAAHPEWVHTGVGAFSEVITRQRVEAYRRVSGMLDGDAYASFRQDFGTWVEDAGWRSGKLTSKKERRLEKNAVALARRLLGRHDKAVRTCGKDADWDNANDMHRLRIECKKLRYAGEFFFTLFDRMGVYLKTLKHLQNTLGLMHDAAVAPELLANMLSEDAGDELRGYADAFVDWRAEQYRSRGIHLQMEWAEFLAAKRPWRKR